MSATQALLEDPDEIRALMFYHINRLTEKGRREGGHENV